MFVWIICTKSTKGGGSCFWRVGSLKKHGVGKKEVMGVVFHFFGNIHNSSLMTPLLHLYF